jgi:DNA polymerase sigma
LVPFQLRLFGSSSTNLYLPTGDIDIAAEVFGPKKEARAALKTIASALRKGRICRDLKVISTARVPLVKFRETLTSLDVDISTNSGTALDAPGLVTTFLSEFPPAKPLIVFLKFFLDQFELADPAFGGLGSYSLFLMVIAYLQQYWVGEQNLGTLLCGFFTFYGNLFNPRCAAVDVRNGGFSVFVPSGNDMDLRIIDPLKADNDVSRSTTRYAEIKSLFVAASEKLRTKADIYELVDHAALTRIRDFRLRLVDVVRTDCLRDFQKWRQESDQEEHQRRREELDKKRKQPDEINAVQPSKRTKVAAAKIEKVSEEAEDEEEEDVAPAERRELTKKERRQLKKQKKKRDKQKRREKKKILAGLEPSGKLSAKELFGLKVHRPNKNTDLQLNFS